jgi:hypothetical protein
VSSLCLDSGCRLAVKRCALGPAGRPLGDCGAGHPLGGGEVGPGARWAGDGDGDVVLGAGVAGWVVGGAGLPAFPDDPAPRAAEGPQRAAVVMPAGARVRVAVSGPGVPEFAGVQDRERVAESVVARLAELRRLAFA